MLADRWRGKDLDLPAEAGQAVGGGYLMLEGEDHLLPALPVGGKGGVHGVPDRVAEYFGERGQCLCRRPDPDLHPRPSGLEVPRPLFPECGEIEVRRPSGGLVTDLDGGDVPGPEDRDMPAAGRDQVPRACLVHQAQRGGDAGRRIAARPGVPELGLLASAQRGGEVAQVRHSLRAAEPAGHVQVNQRGAGSRAAGGMAEPGGDADLAVRRGDGAVQPEVAQGIRDAQD